jgi:hypothetical protein
MAQQTEATWTTVYEATNGNFLDNTTRLITETIMRTYSVDIADSFLFVDNAWTNIPIIIDGGGVAITTGVKLDIQVPFNCVVSTWTIGADQSGSIVLDLWLDTYANYPPTVADTMTGSAKPTLSAAAKATSSTLTGWTTSLTKGSWIRVNVDSVATVTRVNCSLTVKRTS